MSIRIIFWVALICCFTFSALVRADGPAKRLPAPPEAAKVLKAFVDAVMAGDKDAAVSLATPDELSSRLAGQLAEIGRLAKAVQARSTPTTSDFIPHADQQPYLQNMLAASRQIDGGWLIKETEASQTSGEGHVRIGLKQVNGVWRVDMKTFENGRFARSPEYFDAAISGLKAMLVEHNPEKMYAVQKQAEMQALADAAKKYVRPAPQLDTVENALAEYLAARNSLDLQRLELTGTIEGVDLEYMRDLERLRKATVGLMAHFKLADLPPTPVMGPDQHHELLQNAHLSVRRMKIAYPTTDTALIGDGTSLFAKRQADGTWRITSKSSDTPAKVQLAAHHRRFVEGVEQILIDAQAGNIKTYEQAQAKMFELQMKYTKDSSGIK